MTEECYAKRPNWIEPGSEDIFRYNPGRPGEMAEWLKAAVC